MKNYLKNWLEYQEMFGNCRPRTLEFYKQKIECFIVYSDCEDISIFENSDLFEKNFLKIHNSKLAHNTKMKILATLQQFWDFLLKKQIITQNLSREFGKPKIQKIPIIPNTENELSLIYRALDNRYSGNLYVRNRLIFDLFLYSGIRHDELISLKKEDIFFDRITIKSWKGGKFRVVGIPTQLGQELLHFSKNLPKEEYIFPWREWNKATTRMISAIFQNIRKITKISVYPHKLRHTYATECLKNKMDIYTLQQQLGHTNMKTTAIYLNIVPDARVEVVQNTVKMKY